MSLRAIDYYQHLSYVLGSIHRDGQRHRWSYRCRMDGCTAVLHQDDRGSGTEAILDHLEAHERKVRP